MLGQNKTKLNKPLNHEYKTAYDRGYYKAIEDCIKISENTCWKDVDMLVERFRELKERTE